ncbi:MAG: pilus assembly protein PilM [Candidatus Omnitrophica bacterium]|nr:pilus assembly protein PilM [Candidatus Omnitrophota bacterium]
MNKNKVGLYVGVNSLGGVLIDRKKVISMAKFDLDSLEDESRAENLSEDIKWEALINKTLREISADSKNVYLSLADRDFIFRFLEMPLMKRKEVESSLTYEIEKYIPFKLNELRWDYNYISFSKEKKINISFVGIKEDIYQNIQDLFTRLGLTTLTCEPSSVSLARCLKTIKKFSKLKNYAILDLTKTEGYLTFFYYDLPVFNRYFIIPRKEDALDAEELVKPVHLSFEYFKREFKFYQLDKLIVVTDSANEELIGLLKEDVQTDVDVCYPGEFMGTGGCVENIKALGAGDMEQSVYKFRPNLRKTTEQLDRVKKEIPFNKVLIAVLLGVGFLVYGALYVTTAVKVTAEKSLAYVQEQAIIVPSEIKGFSWEEIGADVSKNINQTKFYEKAKGKRKQFNLMLQKLIKTRVESILPSGVWFESINLRSNNDKRSGSMKGLAFMNDEFKEREIIDQFVYALKQDPVIKDIFSKVELSFTGRKKEKEFMITTFSLELFSIE